MASILIVDDEDGIREFLADALETDGHVTTEAADGLEAIRRLGERAFDLMITDLKMPGALDGVDLLRRARSDQPDMEVVVLTAHGTVDSAVEAMKLGAFDYLQKPLSSPAELRILVSRALDRRRLVARDEVERKTQRTPPLTYGDPVMQPVVQALERVAPTTSTVLLLGESGTGKEVAARTIHEQSPRAAEPFVPVNCAAISESLMESEIFGHEKGAFTGATQARRGRLELADKGTLFLDEIGELKPELQAKLLRVLQEARFERVGGTRTIEVDVRWIAATNRDLEAMVASGGFREDLYHRLAVFPIVLPPLRERRHDLMALAETLLAGIASSIGRPVLRLDESARQRIREGTWPGNVRELANALERAAILADGDVVRGEDLRVVTTKGHSPATPPSGGTMEDVERDAIQRALEASDGNRRRAAESLGIGERTLYEKIKKYGL
ncbi:MAG: sigma-54-dependent Fis family transcriptional regulator [Gemmatimonadetes bacterium]|nr:sigma-54-dependent Fis family transcriptional regulator [Gemmatimonadota bacterium]